MTNDVLQIRVEKKVKKDVSAILDNIGLDMSTAIRMFLNSIVKTKSFPLDISINYNNNLNSKAITIDDLNKYMGIGEPSFKSVSDIDKYIKESRFDRKI